MLLNSRAQKNIVSKLRASREQLEQKVLQVYQILLNLDRDPGLPRAQARPTFIYATQERSTTAFVQVLAARLGAAYGRRNTTRGPLHPVPEATRIPPGARLLRDAAAGRDDGTGGTSLVFCSVLLLLIAW